MEQEKVRKVKKDKRRRRTSASAEDERVRWMKAEDKRVSGGNEQGKFGQRRCRSGGLDEWGKFRQRWHSWAEGMSGVDWTEATSIGISG